MRETIISPSILALDYSRVSEQLKELSESRAKWMHFDVMDGHFVPNLTFGPDMLKGFKKATPDMIMDVHIMVDNPAFIAKIFAEAGADIVTFHYEACSDETEFLSVIRYLKSQNVLAGVSIKPGTDVSVLLPYLHEIDLVLIMSVEPGFGGQSFMEDQLDKVRILRKEIDEQELDVKIEIDGGINKETAKLAKDAGVDVLVAGSYVFKGDIADNVDSLL